FEGYRPIKTDWRTIASADHVKIYGKERKENYGLMFGATRVIDGVEVASSQVITKSGHRYNEYQLEIKLHKRSSSGTHAAKATISVPKKYKVLTTETLK